MTELRSGRCVPIPCPPTFDFAALIAEAAVALGDRDGFEEPVDFEEEDPVLDLPSMNQTSTASVSSNTSPIIQETPRLPIAPAVPVPATHALPSRPATTNHANQRRKKRRADEKLEQSTPRRMKLCDAVLKDSTPVVADLDTRALPVDSSGYTAKTKDAKKVQKPRSLQQYLDAGFTLIEWDGVTPRPLVDCEGRVIAMCAGRPIGDEQVPPGTAPRHITWVEACKLAGEAILAAGRRTIFTKNQRVHLRGASPALNAGISYGKGSQAPHNLSAQGHDVMMDDLLDNPHVQRLAGFSSSALHTFNPKIFDCIKTVLDDVCEHDPSLRRNFSNSVYPACAFNFGPQVCCQPHRDSLNFASGWCAIHPLGDFDPKKGGHLVLHELKLVIEFPPASVIFIPSAVITHSNSSIQPGEYRVSFTQYCAGGLFRIRDNGFQAQEVLKETDSDRYEKMQLAKETRWQKGLEMLPRWSDMETKAKLK